MAQIATLVDDIDGSSDDVQTVYFLDPDSGAPMEIDLCAANRKEIGEFWGEYVAHARKSTAAPVKAKRAAGKGRSRRGATAEMREWGRQNGFTVSDRGTPSKELREAYAAAQAAA